MTALRDWLGLRDETPEVRLALLRAQTAAFTRQVPLLYFILCVDAASASYTFAGKAPWTISILIPALLIVGCSIRMVVWLRRKSDHMGTETLQRQLTVTTLLAIVLAVLFVGWVLSLYQYGDDAMRGQVAGTFGITAICCIYCLLHFPIAALILATTAVPTVSLYLASTGSQPVVAFAAALAIVTVGMMYMVIRSSRDFAVMITGQVEAQRLSDQNLRLANIDALTDLPNRRQFFDRLQATVDRNKGKGAFYVGILDLDGFKPVNDVFGHTIGDRVLIECGARFNAALHGDCFLARLGGDEFGVIVEGDIDQAGVLQLGARICDAVKEPFAFDDAIATISTSIGFAAFPDAGETPRQLYERADYALYYAKQNLRGAPVAFSPHHEQAMKGVAVVEQCLRRSELDKELSLVYQPSTASRTARSSRSRRSRAGTARISATSRRKNSSQSPSARTSSIR